jgi:hypothetical protein
MYNHTVAGNMMVCPMIDAYRDIGPNPLMGAKPVVENPDAPFIKSKVC